MKIPKSIFKSQHGYFRIDALIFTNNDENDKIPICGSGLPLFYEKTDDKTIKLDFEENKIYIP